MPDANVDSYAAMLMGYTDDQLAHQFGMVMSGGGRFEQIRFEMERRTMLAQKAAAEATLKGAKAAEKYTFATWIFIAVTALGVAVQSVGPLSKLFCAH